MGLKAKLQSSKEQVANSMIYKSYYDEEIDDNLVYLESRDGLDFTGNIFRIVEELSTGHYGDLKIYVHAKPHAKDKIRKYQENYNLKIDKIITKEVTATRILEKAKYIFTDAGIRPKYVKRKCQIFINTWHGTPLKLMGKDNVAEEHRLGNAQHPLLSSDYLLYPNHYMKSTMLKAFMIDKIFPGKILYEGYPRNSVFLKDSWLKEKLRLADKEIFVYMPTFRGVLMDRDDGVQKDDVENYLSQLDSRLKDSQILYAKLHVLNASRIDFDKFEHIEAFPEGYETYDVLNMADVLITDYSSVFFDFANSRRKIILFNYDEENYCSYRGFYIPLEELPFPKVQNVDELVSELNSAKGYDDEEFIKTYCQYDNPDAVKNILKTVINGENASLVKTIGNGKKNVLIYAGSLTDDMINRLNEVVDVDEYNVVLTFKQWDEHICNNHEEIFKKLPQGIEIIQFRFNLTPTLSESNNSKSLLERSFQKQFPNIEFERIIDLTDKKDEISQILNNYIVKK